MEQAVKLTNDELKIEPKTIQLNPPPNDSDPLLPAKNYLNENFDFRLNEITQRVIFKREDESEYQILTDFLRNTIYLELKGSGKKINSDDLNKLLYSDFIKLINPLKEFIKEVSKSIDDIDFIKQISDTVTVENDKNWHEYFKKWFVAMVANVFDQAKNTNHTCLVLSGEQGTFKTTWLEALVPPEIKAYRYTGQIKPDNKDTLKQLALRLLIIIDDQLHKLNKTNQDDLKFLITLHPVTYRGLFKEFDYDCPRLASFCGSVNGREFLTDITGSRRFLSFYVENIDIESLSNIDVKKAYGQAYKLYLEGFRYWFDSDEVKLINVENEDYTIAPIEQELIEKYFDLTNPKNETYSSTEIKTILESFTKDRLSVNKIGAVMGKLKIERKSIKLSNGNIRKKYGITYSNPETQN
ncbi:MAG: VapE family protein [Bacteroidota bacterium]|nr:VapE family protein [Bacteroidota bacterium]